MPISGSWGYKKSDEKFKSTETLIRNLVDIVSKGGNYLLNVSPTGTGSLLPQATERLDAIGKWMSINSESIYATAASPIGRPDWGRCTAKIGEQESTLYLHVFDWPNDGGLEVVGIPNKIRSASLLDGGQTLVASSRDAAIRIQLPDKPTDPSVSVIKLTVEGEVETQAGSSAIMAVGGVELSADQAFIHNNEGSRDARTVKKGGNVFIGYWTDEQAYLEWNVVFQEAGDYQVVADIAFPKGASGIRVGPRGQLANSTVSGTGDYYAFEQQSLGTIKIQESGKTTIQLRPIAGSWQAVNLRSLRFIPKP